MAKKKYIHDSSKNLAELKGDLAHCIETLENHHVKAQENPCWGNALSAPSELDASIVNYWNKPALSDATLLKIQALPKKINRWNMAWEAKFQGRQEPVYESDRALYQAYQELAESFDYEALRTELVSECREILSEIA
jgi:hypothetical protein